MTKNTIMLFALSLMITLMQSCTFEETDLFENSASERINIGLENASTALVAAPNGWEMLYFTSGNAAGRNLLVKFDANSDVTVAAKNSLTTDNVYKSTKSLWSVIGDTGPVLTFNTYNAVLHAFSDPQSDGVGNGGDYEFVLLSVTNNQIRLKGKKTGAYIILNKLAANQDWVDYFSAISNMHEKLFSNGNVLDLNIGNDIFKAYYGSTGALTIVGNNEDPTATNAPVYGFVTTLTGIRLEKPFMSGDLSVQEFTLNESQSKLQTDNASLMINDIPAYVYGNISTKNGWSINIENANSTLAEHITTFNANLIAAGGSNSALQSLAILYNKNRASYVLRLGYILSGSVDTQDFDIFIQSNGNKLVIKRKNTQSSGATILLSVGGVSDIISSVTGEYVLSDALVPINPTLGIKISDTANINKWHILIGKMF